MHPQSPDIIRRSTAALAATAVLAMLAWLVTAQAQENGAARLAPPAPPAATESYADIPTETLFKQLREAFKSASADQTKEALTLRFIRDDIYLVVNGNEVPPSAGIEHTFYFYRCPCGTILTHGSFVLQDYEVNDVVDTLRQNPQIKIVGTGAFLLGENPRLTLLRFQGEGHDDELARHLSAAFRWIGEARSQPMKPPLPSED